MTVSTTRKGSESERKSSQAYLKMVHSFKEQVSPLRNYLNVVLQLVPCYREPGKRQSLLDHIVNSVLNHGTDGLKLHRALFIQGVKVLGDDESTNFDGFELTSDGYPKHYSDLFKILKGFSGVSLQVASTTVSDGNIALVKIILSILRWPYSVKIELSDANKNRIMTDFSRDVTDNDPKISWSSAMLGERLSDLIRPFVNEKTRSNPLTFISNNRTYKSSPLLRENRGLLPASLGYIDGVFTNFHYNGPVGKVTVLSEKAGKSRVISAYDGSINMTDFYERARSVLNCIDEDVSHDQEAGHSVVQRLTARRGDIHANLTESQILERSNGTFIISADLKAFTDNLYLTGLVPMLDLLNSHDFGAVIQSPIYVGEKVIKPSRALMGLRGTFELASIVHHAIVREVLIRNGTTLSSNPYVMCGDDLTISVKDPKKFLSTYESLCGMMGLKLNYGKTVISRSTSVFCGKVYHFGVDVSPVVPPLFSMYNDMDAYVSASGNFFLKSIEVSKPFSKAAKALILFYGRFFPSRFVPYTLPHKLGGIGFRSAVGLLAMLKRKMFNLMSRIPVPDPFDREVRSVRYPAVNSPDYLTVFTHTPNLAIRGATRPIKRYKTRVPMIPNLKDLLTILEYYYSIGVYSPVG